MEPIVSEYLDANDLAERKYGVELTGLDRAVYDHSPAGTHVQFRTIGGKMIEGDDREQVFANSEKIDAIRFTCIVEGGEAEYDSGWQTFPLPDYGVANILADIEDWSEMSSEGYWVDDTFDDIEYEDDEEDDCW